MAKETKTNAYKSNKKNISKFELMKQLVDLKDVDWIKAVPSQSLQNVIERLDTAYINYFRKLKSGEIKQAKNIYIAKRLEKGLKINKNKLINFGKPKWAKKDRYNSILFKSVKLKEKWFMLPKIGRIKIFKDRLPDGNLKTAIIKKENNNYYLCVTFEKQPEHLLPNENQVGIDAGITYFSVDSNGCYILNPRHFKQFETNLRIEQRSLSRKVEGSNRRKKQKEKVSKIMTKIAYVREDFLHKSSTEYIRNNEFIVCENLKVKNMARNKHLAKHILDCGWSKFFGMFEYKSELYGRQFIKVDPKYTSQKCSECGHVSRKNRLSQSEFKCVKCGFEENTDYNASKNILRRGTPFIRQRETLVCA